MRRRVPVSVAAALTAVLGQALLVVSGPLVARALGPDGRGQLAICVLCVIGLAQLGAMGLPAAVAYEVAKARGTSLVLDHRQITFLLAQGTALAGLGLTAVVLLGKAELVQFTSLLAVSAVVAPVALLIQQYVLSVLQGQHRFAAMNGVRLLPALIYAGGAIVIFLKLPDAGLGVYALLFAVSAAAAGIVGAAVIAMYRGHSAGQVRLASKDVRRRGLQGWLGSSSVVDTFYVDQAIVALMLSPRHLGLYVVAASFSNICNFLLSSMGLIATPRLAAANDPAVRNALARQALRRGAALGFGVAACLELGVGQILVPVFGPDYQDALAVSRVLIAASLLMAIRRLAGAIFLGLGAPGVVSKMEWVALALLVGCGPVLTAMFGIMGAAGAVALSGAGACTIAAAAFRAQGGRT